MIDGDGSMVLYSLLLLKDAGKWRYIQREIDGYGKRWNDRDDFFNIISYPHILAS